MPATDLALLKQAAREAGAIATRYFDTPARSWEKPDGGGPVTEADLAVNTMLARDLRQARPGYGWLSEESVDGPDRLATTHQFIIDPIDGTRAFLEGSKDWAHSLAICENGRITTAVVYLPLRKLMFTAMAGGGAHLNGQSIRVTDRRDLDGASVLAARPSFDGHHWKDGTAPPVVRSFRSSLAYRLCLVAQGQVDAMLTLRATWEWDIAAGALIVAEAGGVATTQRGGALAFNSAHPQVDGVVAAGGVHGGLLDRLA